MNKNVWLYFGTNSKAAMEAKDVPTLADKPKPKGILTVQ